MTAREPTCELRDEQRRASPANQTKAIQRSARFSFWVSGHCTRGAARSPERGSAAKTLRAATTRRRRLGAALRRALAACILCGLGCRATPPTESRELNLRVNPVTIAPLEITLDLSWISPDGHLSPVVEAPIVTVQPKQLASLVDGKGLRCARTGDGIVRVQIGERSASARFKCLMAYTLEHGRQLPLRVLLGSPEPAGIWAIGNGGAVDSTVVVSLASDAPDVLAIDGSRLLPKKLGRATITATAPGPLERSWVFEVAERIGYWQVRPGFAPLSLELSPGNYEVALACTENRLLTVKWAGAPECNYAAKALTHRVPCRLGLKSRLIVVPPPIKDDYPDILELFRLPA